MLLRGKGIEENYVGASWSDKIESKHSTISVKEEAWKTLHFTVQTIAYEIFQICLWRAVLSLCK